MILSPLSYHSLQEQQEGTEAHGKGGEGKQGAGQGKRSDGEKTHREAEYTRCCDGVVSLSLIPPCLLRPLSAGCHALQLKKNPSFVYI